MRQKEALQIYLYKIAHGEKKGLVASIVLAALRILSFVYGFGVRLKLSMYKHGILQQHKLSCFVISLGNITVGGTGKTPTAQRLATIIRDLGYRVVILNRGYRSVWKGDVGLVSDGEKIYMSVTEAGDEAYLMAKKLPGVGVVIGKKRAITGNYAVEKLKAEVIILDDGYQHWELARDLDIVLIDTITVFGNNYLLPRGTLREPLNNLERAHACLLTKVDQSTHDARDSIRDTIKCYNNRALIVESIHDPRFFIEIEEWYKGIRTQNMIPLDIVKGQKILALSAIGNPSSFEQTITDVGAKVVENVRYPDHHDYTMAEMQAVMQKAVDEGAHAIITTEKDAVKIPSEFIHSDRPLRVYVLGIEVYFTEGHEELMDCINQKAREVLHSGGKLC